MLVNNDISSFNLFGEEFANYVTSMSDCIDYQIREYNKGDMIARQGDKCKGLYLLIKGGVKTDMIAENGTLLNIETIKATKPLASAFIFAKASAFPVDVTAMEKSSILFVSREEILKIFQKDENILLKYLQFNSEKTKFLSEKIQMLSLKTIRAKLAHYILNLHSEEQLAHSGSFKITMKNNQTELAAYFGVTRPSLARELSGMARDGLITINKKMVTITNLKGLMEARG